MNLLQTELLNVTLTNHIYVSPFYVLYISFCGNKLNVKSRLLISQKLPVFQIPAVLGQPWRTKTDKETTTKAALAAYMMVLASQQQLWWHLSPEVWGALLEGSCQSVILWECDELLGKFNGSWNCVSWKAWVWVRESKRQYLEKHSLSIFFGLQTS